MLYYFIFNPSDLNHVCIQAQHLDPHGKYNNKDKDSNKKPQGDKKVNATSKMKVDGNKFNYSHYYKDGHDDEKCCNVHPKLFPYNKKKDDEKKNVSLTKIFSKDNLEDCEVIEDYLDVQERINYMDMRGSYSKDE